MYFVQILVKFCKRNKFWDSFLRPKKHKYKNFWNFETRKTQTHTLKEATKLEPKEIQT